MWGGMREDFCRGPKIRGTPDFTIFLTRRFWPPFGRRRRAFHFRTGGLSCLSEMIWVFTGPHFEQ
jgi:hypothetical protein